MPILSKDGYVCGFYSTGNPDNSSYFGIFMAMKYPQLVWSANRNFPVKNNSTLELTSDGDLILTEPTGNISWSTSSSGKSVVGMNLTQAGILVLLDKNSTIVWESTDYPTDTMVLGQKLKSGQKLRPSVSTTNFTETGSLSLSMTSNGLFALVEETDTPQIYYRYLIGGSDTSYLQYLFGNISLFDGTGSIRYITSFHYAASFQFLRFESDGHFRVYEWLTDNWRVIADLFTEAIGACGYPTVCGAYGICLDDQCSCPLSSNEVTYFKQQNDLEPNLGCSETTPLSCIAAQNHSFLELKNVTYFASGKLWTTDQNSCKNACSKNCSCRAAFFRYESNASVGDCNIQQQVLSMMTDAQSIPNNLVSYNHVAYIKVVDVPRSGKKDKLTWFVLPTIGALVGVGFVIGIVVFFLIRRNRRKSIEDEDEDGLDQVPGMPTRFKYEELRAATGDFEKKLGQGGFGSVFEGILSDGTRIAVKRLEGLGQIKDSFLAEVLTIGNIHHVNLVRLVGFCAEKSHRLLVYEFMINGSLERWIFGTETILAWNQRKKIILDIAKGLSYLHEECRQKIIHLDIKPQNILLDENFNAKVSDFGLSKLIDRDQSQVVTTMRGTPGYLAPEWLSATITEKVDVYSFGVVVLEIVSGRKIFDNSKNEEDMHLLNLFRRKAEEEKLIDIVDKNMQFHGEEAVDIIKLAAWCLQSNFANRPTMSKVVKKLESGGDSEVKLDYNFFSSPWMKPVPENGHQDREFASITPLLASALSGPR